MTLKRFHNALRILLSIDGPDFHEAAPDGDWQAFRDDPFRYLIRCDDEQAQALWKLVEARQSKVPLPVKDDPINTHHALVLDGMSLQMKLGKPGHESDTDIGSVVFAFDDDDLQYEQSERRADKTTRWIRIAASEIIELRDFLNKRFPEVR